MLRLLVLAIIATQLAACMTPLTVAKQHRAPWDPDPSEGGSLLNQRRPTCNGHC